jgi:prepilin-type processing-associated H-X9-DG protein
MKITSVVVLLGISTMIRPVQSPDKTVLQFVEAINRNNFDRMEKLVKGGKLSFQERKYLMSPKGMTVSITIMETDVDNNKAKVTLLVSIPMAEVDAKEETVVLVKSGASWFIVPEQGNSGTLNQYAQICNGGMKLAQARSKATVDSLVCTVNLDMLSDSVNQFARENENTYGMTATNWEKKISKFIKHAHIFKCPASKKDGMAYSFNSLLSGKKITAIEEPAKTVLVYEGKNGLLSFHADGKAGVAFVDGNVKRVTLTEAKKLRWKA